MRGKVPPVTPTTGLSIAFTYRIIGGGFKPSKESLPLYQEVQN